ncbi:MAG: hypothetical protein MNPFHGCM_00848 [Gemmatimonadaceae bacterium]|nr:hypothetical protein [Gemmatimonadaceae bacterium]
MRRLGFAIAFLLAGSARAQSVPPITRTKATAQRAVEKTNAQTAAMTAVSDSSSANASDAAARQSPAATQSAREVESAAGTTSASAPSGGFEREVFYYERSGRRDPFASLMTSSELRPLVSDLKLVAVAYDATGRNSVAVLRDVNTKEQYRVRVNNTLGRMRVSAISPKFVTFTIEEFGFSRQENLALGDSNKGSSK